LLGMAVALVGIGLASAGKGYDKLENPSNLFKGYCVPLSYSTELGLCQGLSGSVKVCAAGTQGENRLSARTWYELEVSNRAAYINNKDLVFGDQAFTNLYRTINSKICRQMSPTVTPKTTLKDSDNQDMACNFIWRRDEEIQKNREEAPSPGDPWGVVQYDPPGQNVSRWIFKGVPKNQCDFDYDCRAANDPGTVHTCCDYCEYYFNRFCDTTPEAVFKFCMERVHCVCNSVTKPCYGRYPLYGAACSRADSSRIPSMLITFLSAVFSLASFMVTSHRL